MRVMELHAPLKIVQRSKGRTATAAAAYRAADRIEDERTGQVHDYTKKRGVEGTQLLSAEDAPAWTRDRSLLWNAAEAREKHPRAQTAREVEIAFPVEFNASQRREAGQNVAKLLIARYGSATDIAWHEPNRKGDQRNYHAHVLFTARPVTAEGWSKNKRTALDEIKGDGPAVELKALRSGIAGVLNDIAARDRLHVYVEHMSFEDRGLDREATQHLGPDASEMERRGEITDIGEKNRGIEARNQEREDLREFRSNIVDFAFEKQRRRNPWELFYIDTQARRQQLVQELDQKYGQQEQDHRTAILALQQEREKLSRLSVQNLFARAWKRVSGRARVEEETLASHAGALARIETQKRFTAEAFELDRRQRMEVLKAENAAFERQEQATFESIDMRRFDDTKPESPAREFDHAVQDWQYDDHHEDAPERNEAVEDLRRRLHRKRGRHM